MRQFFALTRLLLGATLPLTSLPSAAQVYGGDRQGWSAQKNENGLRAACNSARNRHNTYVNFFNSARTQAKKKQWREQIDQIKQEISEYCNTSGGQLSSGLSSGKKNYATQDPSGPGGDLRSYFMLDDYPAAAIAAGESGATTIRLGISEIGRVTACTVLESSGSTLLDSTTCRLLQSRARFTPAKDTSGNSISGTFEGTVRWMLPDAGGG